MRLDQFIAQSANVSRKDAKKLIRQGRILLAGEPAKNANERTQGRQVLLDNEPLALPHHRYYMLNKPAGYVSATEDTDHPTALALLPSTLRTGLHIAGRLDKDTTGLLLLTTDGQWSRWITAPRYQVPKTYIVHLASPINQAAIEQLKAGVLLRGETKTTAPAQVTVVNSQLIHLTITEGRYHQVKRMLAAVNNRVETLHRKSIGTIQLNDALDSGYFRELSAEEVASAYPEQVQKQR